MVKEDLSSSLHKTLGIHNKLIKTPGDSTPLVIQHNHFER